MKQILSYDYFAYNNRIINVVLSKGKVIIFKLNNQE